MLIGSVAQEPLGSGIGSARSGIIERGLQRMAVAIEGVVRHCTGRRTMMHTATSSARDASSTVSARVMLNPSIRNSWTSPIACGSLGAAATSTCCLEDVGCVSCSMVVGSSSVYRTLLLYDARTFRAVLFHRRILSELFCRNSQVVRTPS